MDEIIKKFECNYCHQEINEELLCFFADGKNICYWHFVLLELSALIEEKIEKLKKIENKENEDV